MIKRCILATLALCVSLAAQTTYPTPAFPGALATQSQLKLGINGTSIYLYEYVTNTQTTFYVSGCSAVNGQPPVLAANVLITVDQEIMPVASCSGTSLVVASRGFDSTVAAPHNQGAVVAANVAAWNVNAADAEIIAIETALGPNLVHVFSAYPPPLGYTFDGQFISLSAACAAAGPSGTLVVSHPWLLLPTQSLACNIVVSNNGLIQIASGQTVTFTKCPASGTSSRFVDLSLGGSVVIPVGCGPIPVSWLTQCNGSGNDTPGVNSAVATGAAFVPVGYTCMIQAYGGVSAPYGGVVIPSNSHFTVNGTLQAITTASQAYAVVSVSGVSNVVIDGSGSIIGDLVTHNPSGAGQFGFGIYIVNSSNVSVEGSLTIQDNWGDGILVGSDAGAVFTSSLRGFHAYRNRRNNVSVVNARGLDMSGCWLDSAGILNGAYPMSGVDVEPDNGNEFLQEIDLHDCVSTANAGSGWQITLNSAASGSSGTGDVIGVSIHDWQSTLDGSANPAAANPVGAFMVASPPGTGHQLYGSVSIKNVVIGFPGTAGLMVVGWGAYAPANTVIDHVTVINPNASNQVLNGYFPGGWNSTELGIASNSAFVWGTGTSTVPLNQPTGHILCSNCRGEDSRGSPTMQLVHYVHTGGGVTLATNPITADFIDPSGLNWTLTPSGPVGGGMNSVIGSVHYTTPVFYNPTAGVAVDTYPGYTIQPTVSVGLTFINPASLLTGMEYCFSAAHPNGQLITPYSGDTVPGFMSSGVVRVGTEGGNGNICLRSQGTSVWLVPSVSGFVAPRSLNMVNGNAGGTDVMCTGTCTLDASAGDITIALTGSVTSATASNWIDGQKVSVRICQDATGSRTFAWPDSFSGGGVMTISSGANTCSAQQFEMFNGTTIYALGPGQTGQ